MYTLAIVPHMANCRPELTGTTKALHTAPSQHPILSAWISLLLLLYPRQGKGAIVKAPLNKHISGKLQLTVFIFISLPYFSSTEDNKY